MLRMQIYSREQQLCVYVQKRRHAVGSALEANAACRSSHLTPVLLPSYRYASSPLVAPRCCPSPIVSRCSCSAAGLRCFAGGMTFFWRPTAPVRTHTRTLSPDRTEPLSSNSNQFSRAARFVLRIAEGTREGEAIAR